MVTVEVLIASPRRFEIESEWRGNEVWIPSDKKIQTEIDLQHRNGMKWGLRDKDTGDVDKWLDAGEWMMFSEISAITVVDINSDVQREEAERNIRRIFPCNPGYPHLRVVSSPFR
jgi:hypothetical protein